MKQKQTSYALQWDLDSIYSGGGSQSPALQSSIKKTKKRIHLLSEQFNKVSDLKNGILEFQCLAEQCQELESYIACLISQDVNDQEALKMQSQTAEMSAECQSAGVELDAALALLDDETFSRLLEDPDLAPIAFVLKERRQRFKELLPVEQEKLVNKLSVSGFHGWQEIYSSFMGHLKIPPPA